MTFHRTNALTNNKPIHFSLPAAWFQPLPPNNFKQSQSHLLNLLSLSKSHNFRVPVWKDEHFKKLSHTLTSGFQTVSSCLTTARPICEKKSLIAPENKYKPSSCTRQCFSEPLKIGISSLDYGMFFGER